MNINDFKITEESYKQQMMVYARKTGTYGVENAILMEKFKHWVADCGFMTDETVILGIAQDDMRIIPPEQCRYDVVLLGNYETNEEWIRTGVFQAGKYMVMELPHTAEAISLAWQEGIQTLLSKGIKLDFSKPVIERYQKRMVDKHLCEMLFPIY